MDNIILNCTAIHVAERTHETSSIGIDYFLLVRRSSQEIGAWKRIGIGMARGMFYSNEFDDSEEVFEGRPMEVIRFR
jgi:hypothetical protein